MPATQSSVKVFLVDDSLPIRERVAAMLSDHDFDVVGAAANPEQSIVGILSVHPDVVVLDVQLDGGTGLQVLRAVRRAEPDIAFVVLSNNAGPAYRKRYLSEGARRFLDKSTEFDQLATAVEHASRPH